MRALSTLLATILFACATMPASAGPLVEFRGDLRGSNEIPPNASPATGTIDVVADSVLQTVTVTLTVSGLVAPDVAGHIHFAPLSANGPVILPFVGLPTGVTSLSYTHIFTAADLINTVTTGIDTFGKLLAAMEAGNTYVNVHTTMFPGGEIRSQLRQVPEPSSAALLVVAGLVVMVLARRQVTRA